MNAYTLRKTSQSQDTLRCLNVLSDFVLGDHHLSDIREYGSGLVMNYVGDLSTFDFDGLTRLVLLAHRDACRVSIQQGGPRAVKIIVHPRKHQVSDGEKLSFAMRHPSLEELAAECLRLAGKEQS